MLPATGSTITAATASGCASKIRLDGRGVVVGGEQRLRGEGGGHAGRVRQPEGGDAGAGGGEQAVRVAVVAALELHDQVAPGGGAGEPQRAHHGLGPGVDEAHHLHRGQRLDDKLGQLQLRLGRCAERGAARRRLPDGLDDGRVRVAEDQRTERAEVVDVLVAVGVGDDRARAAVEHDGVAADGAVGARRRVDAAGEHGPRPLHQRARAVQRAASRPGAHEATALARGTPSAAATSDSSVTSRGGRGGVLAQLGVLLAAHPGDGQPGVVGAQHVGLRRVADVEHLGGLAAEAVARLVEDLAVWLVGAERLGALDHGEAQPVVRDGALQEVLVGVREQRDPVARGVEGVEHLARAGGRRARGSAPRGSGPRRRPGRPRGPGPRRPRRTGAARSPRW